MSSVEFRDTQKSLAESLHETLRAITDERVTLRGLLSLVGEQGMLLFCMVLCIPFLLPVAIPGVSTPFGLIILLIGGGITLNRVPWLPRALMERQIERVHLAPALERGAQLFARLDRVLRPRVLVLTRGAAINRFNGLMIMFGALLLMVPLGAVPLTNTLPAWGILLLCAGMMQRDGLCIAVGYLAEAATVIWFAVIFGSALLAGHGLTTILS